MGAEMGLWRSRRAMGSVKVVDWSRWHLLGRCLGVSGKCKIGERRG